MNSKVTAVNKTANTWTTKSGKTMYDYQVTLEDGTTGIASSTGAETTPYGVGDEVEYTKTENSFGVKLKIQKAGSFSGGGYKQDPEVTKRITNSWAITTAVSIVGQNTGVDMEDYIQGIKQLSNRLIILRDNL